MQTTSKGQLVFRLLKTDTKFRRRQHIKHHFHPPLHRSLFCSCSAVDSYCLLIIPKTSNTSCHPQKPLLIVLFTKLQENNTQSIKKSFIVKVLKITPYHTLYHSHSYCRSMTILCAWQRTTFTQSHTKRLLLTRCSLD